MQELDELSFWKRAALILALVALVALLGCDGRDAQVTAQLVSAARERACIAQFGPSERWTRHTVVYECVSGTREMPAHILSYPVAAQ